MFSPAMPSPSQSRRFPALARATITLVFGLSLLLAATVSVAAQPGGSDDIRGSIRVDPDAPVRLARAQAPSGEDANRALHGSLARLRTAHSRNAANPATTSGVSAELIDGPRVLVEVRTRPGSDTRGALNAVAAEVRHRFSPDMFEAWLPIEQLDELAARPEVVRAWPARTARLLEGSVTSQGVAAGRADQWHAGGLDGSGITIAIIDSFDDNSGEVNDLQASGDWPPDSRLTTVKVGSGSFGDNGVNHGNAVLEIAHDIAPGADFIAYDTRFLSDWREAIDQAVSDGADIISASLGAPLDGIGDGSARPGSVAEKVEDAEAAGVIYINSAGNSREQHWGGRYDPGSAGTDPDLHSWDGVAGKVNPYGPGDGSAFCLGDGTLLRGELFWNDWTFVNNDFALVLFEWDGSSWVEIEREDSPQNGLPGQTPQEFLQVAANSQQADTCSGPSQGAYGWGVFRNITNAPRNLQFFTTIPLDERLEARSLTFPADSPSAYSVAALNVADSSHEFYSSEGPILAPGGDEPEGDEPPKPDTASFARVSTVSAGSFAGTSASAPHVAGMAALVRQRHPDMPFAQFVERLDQISAVGSNDLGTSGHDFQHGHGRLRFQLEDSLAVVAQPGNVQVNDPIGPVELEVRDDEGLVVLSGPSSELSAAIGNEPSGADATLSGTSPVPVSDGAASFDDLSIDTTGAGYTLSINSASPGPVETDGFDVNAGSPARLSFDVQPGDGEAGQALTPSIVVQVLDSDGNVVVNDDSTEIALSIVAGPGSAELSGGGPVSVSNGEAVFDAVSIDEAASGYQLEASDTGASLDPDTSVTFDIVPGDPASLVFDVQPADTQSGQPISPAITVQVLDSAGNVVIDDNSTEVGLSIATGPAEAVLSGADARTVSGGKAVFDAVSIDVADAGYQLEAADTAGALASATSVSFDITPGDPAGLVFDVQPGETQVNEAVTPAITVQVVDDNGNRVTDDSSSQVELSIAAGPAGATLSGGGPVTAGNGEAVFDAVSLDEVGSDYRLEAAGGSLAEATSTAFDIIAGDPVSLSFVVQPSNDTTGDPIEPAVEVEVLDSEGNRVAWDNDTVVELLLSGGSGGTLSGGDPLTVTGGLAVFDALAVDQAGSDYKLEAVDPDGVLPPIESMLFDITDDDIFDDRFEGADP